MSRADRPCPSFEEKVHIPAHALAVFLCLDVIQVDRVGNNGPGQGVAGRETDPAEADEDEECR